MDIETGDEVARPSRRSAPLLGHNLVRLLYLDEAGSDRKAPFLCVAGVLVHGDRQWPEIDRRLVALIDQYVPQDDRTDAVFHATDIFHGSRYFDRRKPEWPQHKREALLRDLAKVIDDLALPVVFGTYQKDGGLANSFADVEPIDLRERYIHNAAAMDCLMRADNWLARFAPDELATVVHEDGTPAKPNIKHTMRILRSEGLLQRVFGEGYESFGLPLKRIIDSVNFIEKPDARPLQLADLCAFILGRGLKGLLIPGDVLEMIWRNLEWVFPAQGSSPTEILGALGAASQSSDSG